MKLLELTELNMLITATPEYIIRTDKCEGMLLQSCQKTLDQGYLVSDIRKSYSK